MSWPAHYQTGHGCAYPGFASLGDFLRALPSLRNVPNHTKGLIHISRQCRARDWTEVRSFKRGPFTFLDAGGDSGQAGSRGSPEPRDP